MRTWATRTAVSLAACIVTSLAPVTAATSTIAGRVVEAGTGEPLAGFTVRLYGFDELVEALDDESGDTL